MEAKLKILTKQYDEVGTVDTIEVDTIGKIFEKNKDIYVVYEEIEEDQKITTTVRISDDEVSIKRFGNVNSLMVFKEKHKHLTKYRTNQGLFIIETETNKLVVDKSEKNYIKLNIEYNYVFVMPYVDIDDAYKFEDFIENNLIDQTKLEEILTGEVLIDKYLKGKNNEIDLNLFLLKICPEYYVLNDKIHLKKFHFIVMIINIVQHL